MANLVISRLEFFSESRIDLQKEIPNHPELVSRLQNHPAGEFEVRLAEIASYVGLVLDGDYTPEDLDNICEICRHKLWKKRSPIILSSGIVNDILDKRKVEDK